MSTAVLDARLVEAEQAGTLPKIVVPVHFAGQSCNMREIRSLADRYGFHIVEDASHAIGGKYLDVSVGSCRHADITVFSFHPVKIITMTCIQAALGLSQLARLDEFVRRRNDIAARYDKLLSGIWVAAEAL